MRTATRTVVVLAIGLLLLTGCSRTTRGAARPDPTRAPVAITDDGYGITLGFADAPVRLELFTEPQCNHCADLQAAFGDQFAHYIAVGQLALTYRPLTFFDTGANLHSDRVATALFAAAGSGETAEFAVTGPAFQHFVMAAWAQYDAGPDHPTVDELGEMARAAGLPDEQVAKVASGAQVVDTTAMENANHDLLYGIDSESVGTPTVYDLVEDEKVDTQAADWLSELVRS